MLDIIAKWGPWLLAALAALPAAASWRTWQSRETLPRGAFLRGLISNVFWLAMIGISLWVLQIRMAPLTRSLVTLQAQTGRPVPEIVFRRMSDDRRFLRHYPGEGLCGYSETLDWLSIKNFRPFTLVIDRRGILRGHFFGSASYEAFESSIRPYL